MRCVAMGGMTSGRASAAGPAAAAAARSGVAEAAGDRAASATSASAGLAERSAILAVEEVEADGIDGDRHALGHGELCVRREARDQVRLDERRVGVAVGGR